MVTVDIDSKELAIHRWLNLESSLQLNVIIVLLASLIPGSVVMEVPSLSIVRDLELNSIDLSFLISTASISSPHERHL